MPSILTRPSGGGGVAGGSVSVVVSDASPSIGDTITITATASGYTPDSYLFFAYDDTADKIYFIAEQASNTFDWTISGLIPATNLTIYVLGVQNGTPDITAFDTVDIVVSSSLLLDTVEGAGANFAFSFFSLRAGYNGFAALIRRSSDNAQKGFYFDTNNVLSLSSEDGSGTTLADWITTDDGYLVTGYSQDTAGVTFTASNAADQCRIIIGGSLVDINDAVAMVGNNELYLISTSLTVKSAFIVAKNDGYNATNSLFNGVTEGMSWGGSFAGVDGINMSDGSNNLYSNIETLNTHLASFFVDTGIYVDGNLQASGTLNDLTITTVANRQGGGILGMNGKIACIVSYATDKTADREVIEANINSNFTPSLLP